MTALTKVFFLLLCFTATLVSVPEISAQPITAGDKYNLIVSDQTLGAVLDQLARTAGVAFSYNPDQIGINRKITLRITQQTLPEILEQLFDVTQFDFRAKGNQIVIFRKADKEKETENISPISRPRESLTAKPDTVYLYRERRITDTLMRTDTVRRTDTVFITKKQPEDKIGGKDIFRNNPSMVARIKPEFSLDVGLKLSAMLSGRSYTADAAYDELITAYQKADSGFAFSGAAGVMLNLNYNRLTLSTGIELTQLAHKFNFDYTVASGGYYLKDTLDDYYTTVGLDTTWFFLVDSAYVAEDIKQYKYNTTVKQRYLDFPLLVRYNLPVSRNLFYFNAGIIAGVSVGKSGYYLLPENQGVENLNTLKNRPLLISVKIGAGCSFPISSKLVLNAGVHYRHALQSMYKDFELKTYPSALSADVSLMLRL